MYNKFLYLFNKFLYNYNNMSPEYLQYMDFKRHIDSKIIQWNKPETYMRYVIPIENKINNNDFVKNINSCLTHLIS